MYLPLRLIKTYSQHIVLFLIFIEFNSKSSSIELQTLQQIPNEKVIIFQLYVHGKRKAHNLDIITLGLSFVLNKCKTSDRDTVDLLTACVYATSLNYVINRTSIRRSRQHFRESINGL